MCIPNFDDFIAMNPIYKGFSNSSTAELIYIYLSRLDTIDSMIAANTSGRPALYGAQAYIEANFAGRADFQLSEGRVRQCVGTMVRTILQPLGYEPKLQRDLPKAESLYFTSATHYAFLESNAKCRLVKHLALEEIR